MNPTHPRSGKIAPVRPVRFAGHLRSESQLQDELHAWLVRAVERDGPVEVARNMKVGRVGLWRLMNRHKEFSLHMVWLLNKAYPEA